MNYSAPAPPGSSFDPYAQQPMPPPVPPRPKMSGRKRALLWVGLPLSVFVLLIAIGIGASGAKQHGGGSAGTPPAAAPSPTPSASVFYADVQSQFPQLAGAGNIVTLGQQICTKRAADISQAELIKAIQPDAASIGFDPQAFIQLAETDLCPSYLVGTITVAPQYTTAQQQAITSAESYLSSGQGFSRKGLIHQLSSKYGEGFSGKLAVFAVDHVKVNWYKQAVISAKGYLRSGQGFSYSGLVEQLSSPYGEQFTLAQAQYAAKAVGLTP